MKLDIPSDWRDTLAVVQSISPGAIIGGGALRDLDNDTLVKDLDLFVDADANMGLIQAAFASEGYRLTQDLSSDYVDGDMFEVSRIVELQNDYGLPVNIIAVLPGKTPAEDAERYDWGLCQIFYDGETVHATDAYHRDKINKTLTLCRCNSHKGFDRSIRRFDRLSRKYPDHRQVILPEFTLFERRAPRDFDEVFGGL